jgi:hypothetical protein
MSLQEIIERNDRIKEQVRVLLQEKPNLTTRAISKEIGVDKRVLNQILYYMAGVHRNEDRIPKWSWREPRPPRPRRRVIASLALHDWFHEHPAGMPAIAKRKENGVLYLYLANENPEGEDADADEDDRHEMAVLVVRARQLGIEAREAARVAEETPDPGVPELECSSCGVTTDALLCCRAGAFCSKCMDDIDPASGKRRRDL